MATHLEEILKERGLETYFNSCFEILPEYKYVAVNLEEVFEEIKNGTLKVPEENILDPRIFAKEEAKCRKEKAHQKINAEYLLANRKLAEHFESICEEHYDLTGLNRDFVNALHRIAWENGHSSGHYEVFNYLGDLVDSFQKYIDKNLR